MNIGDLILRISNYFKDGGPIWRKKFWQRRWIKAYGKKSDNYNWLKLGPYDEILSKEANPNWRLEQPWILLTCKSCHPPVTVCIKTDDGLEVYKTLLPVKTKLFAMRVSAEAFYVTISYKPYFPNYKPELVNGDTIPLSFNTLIELEKRYHRKITYI